MYESVLKRQREEECLLNEHHAELNPMVLPQTESTIYSTTIKNPDSSSVHSKEVITAIRVSQMNEATAWTLYEIRVPRKTET